MKEHNKKTLIEALSSLPEYEPPDRLWDDIEQQAGGQGRPVFSKKMLEKLPVYSPSDHVWQRIEGELVRQSAAKIRVLTPRRRSALVAAASLALLLTAFWLLNRQPASEPEQFAISYSTETVDPMLMVNDWDEDEGAFQEFAALCENKIYVCEQPQFQQLQAELEELTQAKEELKSAIGSYGADAELVLQIKEIELERTDILKRMMVMLI